MLLERPEATDKPDCVYCGLTFKPGVTIYARVSSLVAAVAAVQRPLASDTVRLRGSLQSQPATEGRRAGLVRGKAMDGMAKPRMAKLRAWKAIFGAGRQPGVILLLVDVGQPVGHSLGWNQGCTSQSVPFVDLK